MGLLYHVSGPPAIHRLGSSIGGGDYLCPCSMSAATGRHDWRASEHASIISA